MVGGTAGYMQWHSRIYGGGLFDYSVKPGPDLIKIKARLVTRLRFGQVGLVGQGQGQELDNCIIFSQLLPLVLMYLQMLFLHF